MESQKCRCSVQRDVFCLFNSGYTVGHGEVQSSSISGGTSPWCMWLWLLTRWRPTRNGVIWHKSYSVGSTHRHNVTPTSVSHFVGFQYMVNSEMWYVTCNSDVCLLYWKQRMWSLCYSVTGWDDMVSSTSKPCFKEEQESLDMGLW